MANTLLTSVFALSLVSGAAFAQTASQPGQAGQPGKQNTPAASTGGTATTTQGQSGQAQTGTAQTGQTQSGQAQTGQAGKTGMQTATTATMVVKFVAATPADVLSSNLVGTDVYNNQNENIGEIEDLVIENGKTVRALVIGTGGFLGIGERYAAVDPSTVVLVRQDNNSWRAVMNTSREDLKNAPEFKYDRRRR